MDTAFETAQHASALDSNSLLAQIMEETQLQPGEESYDIALRGVEAFIADLLKSESTNEKINKAVVDRMIVEVDAKITGQVDAIIHHPSFQEMESAWRGLKILVDRTDFRENIKIDVLSVSKTDLLEDFELAPEVVQSGLYKHVYGR
jgi:type VI secretion system protein ImpC